MKKKPNSGNQAPATNRKALHTELLLSAQAQAALGMAAWATHIGEVDLPMLADDLRSETKAISDGDQRKIEARLIG